MIETKKKDRLLSVKEAAEMLGVWETRIRALIAENRIPAEKIGRALVIRESDLLKFEKKPHGRPKKKDQR